MNAIQASQPMVSVLLPVLNGQATVHRAAQSILSQSYKNLELLIINDGSTDGTAVVLEALQRQDGRIKIITHERNKGVQKSLNEGLRQAEGVYIARIDADDIWSNTYKLEQQIIFLQNHHGYVLVGTGVTVVDHRGKEITRYVLPETDTLIRTRMLGKNCFAHSTVVFSKAAALAVGGYSESLQTLHVEDYELWLKLGTKGGMYNIRSYDISFTMHQQSISVRNRMLQCKNSISLIKRFKKDYPYYTISMIKARIRFVAQTFFGLLPAWLQHFIFTLDKNY
jgi:glycosyltransferase involved in cell wall biosynthesis